MTLPKDGVVGVVAVQKIRCMCGDHECRHCGTKTSGHAAWNAPDICGACGCPRREPINRGHVAEKHVDEDLGTRVEERR